MDYLFLEWWKYQLAVPYSLGAHKKQDKTPAQDYQQQIFNIWITTVKFYVTHLY